MPMYGLLLLLALSMPDCDVLMADHNYHAIRIVWTQTAEQIWTVDTDRCDPRGTYLWSLLDILRDGKWEPANVRNCKLLAAICYSPCQQTIDHAKSRGLDINFLSVSGIKR